MRRDCRVGGVRVRRHPLRGRGWGVGELRLDGGRLLWHESVAAQSAARRTLAREASARRP